MSLEPSLRVHLRDCGLRWSMDVAAHNPDRWRRLRCIDGHRNVFVFRAGDPELDAVSDETLHEALAAALKHRDWPALCALLEIDFAIVAIDLRGHIVLARGGVGRERLFHRASAGMFEVESDLARHVQVDDVDREAFCAYLASAAGPVSGDLTFTTRTVASHAGWARCVRAAITRIELATGKVEVLQSSLDPDPGLCSLSDDELGVAMRDAVTDHLRRRAPEGACAVELSGGIDSSIIASTLTRLNPARETVGVGVVYPYYEFRHERRYMEDIARSARLQRIEVDGRHCLLFDPTSGGDQPTGEPSLVQMGKAYKRLVIETAAGAGAGALFNGHGGDQLFAMSPYTTDSLIRRVDYSLIDAGLNRDVHGQLEAYRDNLEKRHNAGQRHYFAGLLLYDGWMEDFARGTGIRCEPGLLSVRTLQLSWEMFRRDNWRDTGILRKRFARHAFRADLPDSIIQRRWKVGYDGLYRRGLYRNAPRLANLLASQSDHLRAMGVRVDACQRLLDRVRDMRFDEVELLYPLLCYALWRDSFIQTAPSLK